MPAAPHSLICFREIDFANVALVQAVLCVPDDLVDVIDGDPVFAPSQKCLECAAEPVERDLFANIRLQDARKLFRKKRLVE